MEHSIPLITTLAAGFGMALILGVDRFMSECRALTNLVGNATASIVVARWEGELDRDQLNAALNDGAAAHPAPEAPQPGLPAEPRRA